MGEFGSLTAIFYFSSNVYLVILIKDLKIKSKFAVGLTAEKLDLAKIYFTWIL